MKKFFILLLTCVFLLTLIPVEAREHKVPHRYRDTGRVIKHAGSVKHGSQNVYVVNYKTPMTLNYETGTNPNYSNIAVGANYKSGGNYNYRTATGCNYKTQIPLNYRPATVVRYR